MMTTQILAEEYLPNSSLVYAGDKATFFEADVPVPRLRLWFIGLRRAIQCCMPLFPQDVFQIVQHSAADALLALIFHYPDEGDVRHNGPQVFEPQIAHQLPCPFRHDNLALFYFASDDPRWRGRVIQGDASIQVRLIGESDLDLV